MVSSAFVLILALADRHAAVLRRAADPRADRNGSVTPDFTPNIYASTWPLAYAQFNYASALRSRWARGLPGGRRVHGRHPQRGSISRERTSAAKLSCSPWSATLIPVWWLVVASTKNAQGLFSGSGALWFHGFHLLDNLHDLSHPSTTASTCAGWATRCCTR
ncbi:hypothetical protein GCM10020358_22820 [Amorphoplanes nipponensis]